MRSEDSKVILVHPIGVKAHTFTTDPLELAQGIESAVKLGFAGTQCPSHIYVGFPRYAVFSFNAPHHCYCCQRLGHVAVNCNSPFCCLVCSGPHTKDECTTKPEQEKCANCHQTHIASFKECLTIRNTAATQKLQCSGVGFEAAKHKVIKTQSEHGTKVPFMKKQNLTVPIVSSNIVASQHSIQGNQQENQNDLTIQEVMVDIHQLGGSYLWSDAEALPSTASSSPLYSSVVQGLDDLPSTSQDFQLSGVQERTPSNDITQPAKKPSPQMTTAAECAEIISKSVASLGKKLKHQLSEMGRERISLAVHPKHQWEGKLTQLSNWRAICNCIRKNNISNHFRRHSPTTATTGSDESIRGNNANYLKTEESREVSSLTMEELNSLSALKNKAPGQDGVYDRCLQKLPLQWKKELLCVLTQAFILGVWRACFLGLRGDDAEAVLRGILAEPEQATFRVDALRTYLESYELVSPRPATQSHSRYWFDSRFMPNFATTAKKLYTETRIKALMDRIYSQYGKDRKLFVNIGKKQPEFPFCPVGDVEKCLCIFADLGFTKEELLKGLPLLVQNPSALLAQKQLTEDLGLLCRPKVGFIRLCDLMEVTEQELVDRGFLPAQPSVMEQLLSKVGEQHVAGREQLLSKALSKSSPLKFTYYEILAGLLAQRFDVSPSDTKQLLQTYQPSYKPLGHYYFICDLITRKFEVDFQHVCKLPEILDIFPVAALSLMSRHPTICSVSTPKILSAYPALTFGSADLLTQWLELLSRYGIDNFRITPLVQWVLRQDLIEMAQLVLMFLPGHPFWSEIKKSTFLFEIFANPTIMDKLMNWNKSKSVQKESKNHSTKFSSAGSTYVSSTTSSLESSSSTTISPSPVNSESSIPSTSIGSTRKSTRFSSTMDNSDSTSACPPSAASACPPGHIDPQYKEDRSAGDPYKLLSLLSVDSYSPVYSPEKQYHAPFYVTKVLKLGRLKWRPPYEVSPYLEQRLGVSNRQVIAIGWCLQHKASLRTVVAIMAMLTEEGFTRQQMKVALPIFSADPERVREQLHWLNEQEESYMRYWKEHPNCLNLLLYRVRSRVLKIVLHDEDLDQTEDVETDDEEDNT
ncbi:hypothetical protein FHG87_003006 [Trinorchestia longiramus]|nr:hypothetical protein FHG87_003006 [Trinorchestia longiramus]